MTFEFIIACRTTSGTDIRRVLTNLLAGVLENNLNEFDTDAVDQMIQFRHVRDSEESADDNGVTNYHRLVSFSLDLPEEAPSAEAVVQEFAGDLPNTPPIFHAVKFEDPLLQAQLARHAAEIFALEMKLRRVLLFIYLHAYQSRDPFNLLRDEKVKPMGAPTPQQMQSAAENEFFHLTFGNYAELNQRQEVKFKDLLEIIRDTDTYEKFYEELSRVPIAYEDDAELLAGLSSLMDAIEKMRNCVAHNRRPSTRLTGNYNNALPQLHEMLDNYLSRWDLNPLDRNEEMPWDTAAREAVERVLEDALWDHKAKTITLYNDGAGETVTSLEELQEYLEQLASSAFDGNVPYEDGEPVFQCDEYGVVESVLYGYEERLTEFFEENGTDGLS